MTKIDLTIHPDRLERVLGRVREKHVIIPTYAQQRNPELVPDKVKNRVVYMEE
jgi:cysteine synthase A